MDVKAAWGGKWNGMCGLHGDNPPIAIVRLGHQVLHEREGSLAVWKNFVGRNFPDIPFFSSRSTYILRMEELAKTLREDRQGHFPPEEFFPRSRKFCSGKE
jgi:hypothetical protein